MTANLVRRPTATRNRLLGAVPLGDIARLAEVLQPVALRPREILFGPGETPRYVYFPLDCIISLCNTDRSGRSVDAALVGNDGAAGVPFIVSAPNALTFAVVQTAGHAVRMDASQLKREFEIGGLFPQLLLRYALTLISQIAQNTICYRHHSISQQLSRWILMGCDRIESDELHVTHELLAVALGARREGITNAAGALHRSGIILNDRGRIQLLDRKRLERSTCECYTLLRDEYERLLGFPP